MADHLQSLLDYIVRHYTGRAEAAEIERNAPSARGGAGVDQGRQQALRDERQRAQELADAFSEGLRRAQGARQAGETTIALDDRRPDEDRIADALVHILATPELATAEVRETEPAHSIYAIAMDWDRLDQVARRAGIDLAAALR